MIIVQLTGADYEISKVHGALLKQDLRIVEKFWHIFCLKQVEHKRNYSMRFLMFFPFRYSIL